MCVHRSARTPSPRGAGPGAFREFEWICPSQRRGDIPIGLRLEEETWKRRQCVPLRRRCHLSNHPRRVWITALGSRPGCSTSPWLPTGRDGAGRWGGGWKGLTAPPQPPCPPPLPSRGLIRETLAAISSVSSSISRPQTRLHKQIGGKKRRSGHGRGRANISPGFALELRPGSWLPARHPPSPLPAATFAARRGIWGEKKCQTFTIKSRISRSKRCPCLFFFFLAAKPGPPPPAPEVAPAPARPPFPVKPLL